MNRTDLRDVLELVKEKLSTNPETGCGLFWADDPPVVTTYYAVGEEDAAMRYAVIEEKK